MKTEIFGIPITEVVGYLASLGVLCSFAMKDIRKLRFVNTIGCMFFIAYGFLLGISWPIVITNVAIVIINIYYLSRQKV
jgi:hypothetical protein